MIEVGFAQSVSKCFRYSVEFSGRASRSEFWWFVLFVMVLYALATSVNSAIFGPTISEYAEISQSGGDEVTRRIHQTAYDGGVFSYAVFALTILPLVAAAWRRLHDTGRSGAWALLPVAAAAIAFVVVAVSMLLEAISLSADGVSWRAGATVFLPQSSVVLMLAMLIYIGALATLIWWLRGSSQPGANRYGPNPNEARS